MVEVVNVHLLEEWDYSERMLVIPGLEVGLLPLIQLPLLTVLTFVLVGQRPRSSCT